MGRPAKIKTVRALEILDSRGVPTLEAEVVLADGTSGRGAVPSGASTGEHEAVELRDGDPKRHHGKGVLRARENVIKVLGPAVVGRDPEDQVGLDEVMLEADGTPNKARLGANALLAVSMAAARAAAAARGVQLYEHLRRVSGTKAVGWLLPAPMLNVINGGKHADSGLDVQEFMIVPTGAKDFAEALRIGAETYHILKKLLAGLKESTAVGDEGGFAPRLGTHSRALDILVDAVERSGAAKKLRLALDVAASEFHAGKAYRFEGATRTPSQMADTYAAWIERYPFCSIEDPFDEDDWAAWTSFTARCGSGVRVVGDDLFVTNLTRLERGIRDRSANSILVKLNQIGTVTETVRAVLRAQECGFTAIISHRSGETEDPFIADLAVALNAGAIKTGAPCRSERLAKYNRLLRIGAELGTRADYAGAAAFRMAAPARRGGPRKEAAAARA